MKKMRESVGLSQQGLSDLCNDVSRSMVSAIECCERDPSLSVICDIASALEITPMRVVHALVKDRAL